MQIDYTSKIICFGKISQLLFLLLPSLFGLAHRTLLNATCQNAAQLNAATTDSIGR